MEEPNCYIPSDWYYLLAILVWSFRYVNTNSKSVVLLGFAKPRIVFRLLRKLSKVSDILTIEYLHIIRKASD